MNKDNLEKFWLNPVSYKPLNFAYINYESEDARQKAIKTNYKLNGRDLFWYTENARICNRCGSPSYLFNECPVRKQDSKKQQLNKFYNCYHPAQHHKPKSYTEAAKARKDDKSHDCNPSAKSNSNNSQCQDKRQQSCATPSSSNLNGGIQQGGSMHGAQAEKFTGFFSSSSLMESQENPVNIEALKKEKNFEDYNRDGDEDDNMDEEEFDEDGYLLNPTDDA
ncbi:hypothetical protein C1645_833281 [Glomus cerebriforme]|uniref:CCHC-type domain-containing protein n=1 Tax=Glomus cerebriforme TaxID=658196 RepID=A0A397SCQ9_9GLOM|nr:hypothetical protein C1645_833281 [Glomus cerebriforme]